MVEEVQPVKIRIVGYQGIKDITLEVLGITFIVGKSNQCKSAIVRAVEAALFNQTGNEFINDTMKKAVVGLQFPISPRKPPLTVVWTKTKTTATYNIDGVSYTKLNKAQPPVLAEAGFREILVGDRSDRLMFWRQMESPFLVFERPSQIFAVISRLMEEKGLNQALLDMRADFKTIKDSLVKKEGQIEALKQAAKNHRESAEKFSPVDSLSTTISDYEKKTVILSKLVSSLASIQRNEERQTSLSSELTGLTFVASSLRPVIDRLASCLTQFSSCSAHLRKLVSKEQELQKAIQEEEALASVSPLLQRFNSFSLSDFVSFYRAEASLGSNDDAIEKAKQKIEIAEQDQHNTLTEFNAFKEEMKVCPLCERLFDD